MLEEKSKIVEMMNEANNIFEGATRHKSMSMASPSGFGSSLEGTLEGIDSIIKPQYLDEMEANKKIDNLPYEVKVKMQAHTEACTSLVFSPIGDLIATGGADKTVCLWSSKNLQM
jgi:WD40 repeat protein